MATSKTRKPCSCSMDACPFARLGGVDWPSLDAAADASMRIFKAAMGSTWEHRSGKAAALKAAAAALSSSPGAWNRLASLVGSKSDREWIAESVVRPLSAKEQARLVAKGELPWALHSALPSNEAWIFDGHEFRHSNEPHLTGTYAYLIACAAIGRYCYSGGYEFPIMASHLGHPAEGAKRVEEAVGMACAWLARHAEDVSEEAPTPWSKKRLAQILDLGPCDGTQRASIQRAVDGAAQKRRAERLAHERARNWADSACWAIRSDSVEILAPLLAAASAGGIEILSQEFPAPSERAWRWNPEDEDRYQNPSSQTLLEAAIEAKAGSCADALAAMAGISKAFFDDGGKPGPRSPFTKIKPALATGEPAWLERFCELSIRFAEDLRSRGLDPKEAAKMVESAAGRMVSKRGSSKTTRAGANVERALMKQAARVSDWLADLDANALPLARAAKKPKRI